MLNKKPLAKHVSILILSFMISGCLDMDNKADRTVAFAGTTAAAGFAGYALGKSGTKKNKKVIRTIEKVPAKKKVVTEPGYEIIEEHEIS